MFSAAIAIFTELPLAIRDGELATALTNVAFIATYLFLCWNLHLHLVFLKRDHRILRTCLAILTGTALIPLFFNPLTISILRDSARARFAGISLVAFFICRGLFANLLAFFFLYYLDLGRKEQKARLENEVLRRENLEARLGSLSEQIRPHFLFNSLATLRSLTENPEAKEFVSRLAEVYRHLLDYGEEPTVPLSEELAFLEAYLHILRSRHGDSLRVLIDIRDEDRAQRVPPLSLQVLVENAVKHNVVSASRPLSICVSSCSGELVVENDLQPKLSVEPGSGLGLRNVAARYQLLSGREIAVTREGGRFRVALPLLP